MSKQSKRVVKWMSVAAVGILAVAAGLVAQAPIEAQDHGAAGPAIAPSGSVTLSGEIRTSADIQAASAKAPATSGSIPGFLPTVSAEEYAAQKAAAAASGGGASAEAAAPSSGAPTLQFISFEGLAAAGLAPSDSNGAVGHTQYVEAVNASIRVFTKGVPGVSQPTIVNTFTLPAFFGTAESLFDPRVIYDPVWQRWVVAATRRATSDTDTVHKFYLAVSMTNNANGGWCTYGPGFTANNGDWWDYPQLGMDYDGLILTGNIFHRNANNSDSFVTTNAFAIPKGQVYNCLGFGVPLFSGLLPTLAPPIVRDLNSQAILLASNGGVLRKYTMTNSSRNPGVSLTGPVTITGTLSIATPPNASQFGTGNLLDTLDTRFQNASTQLGSQIWNTHPVNFGGVSAVRWYRLNHTTNSVVQQGTVGFSGIHTFNPSIAVNDSSNAFMTYSLSGTAYRPLMRYTGKLSGDAVIPGGLTLFASPASFSVCSTSPCRWGDYSAVSIDPSDQSKAWIVSQIAGGTSHFNWRTRIARIGQ